MRTMRAAVIALGAVTLLGLGFGACGGGSDGPEDPFQGFEPTILRVYNYRVAAPAATPTMNVEFATGLGTHVASLMPSGNGITGTYDTLDYDWTIAAGAAFTIDTNAGPVPLLGSLLVTTTQEVLLPFRTPPASGAMEVKHQLGTAEIVFTGPGVDLSINGAPATSYTWDAFEDLNDVGTPVEQAAVFVFDFMRFLYARLDQVVVALRGTTGDLEVVNPREMDCPPWPLGTTIPIGWSNPGSFAFRWIDVNGDREISSGDDFQETFDSCRSFENLDDVYFGTILYKRYTEVVDRSNRVIRIGFEPGAGDGGVFFDDFQVFEVDEVGMVVTVHTELVVNGGLIVSFVEP